MKEPLAGKSTADIESRSQCQCESVAIVVTLISVVTQDSDYRLVTQGSAPWLCIRQDRQHRINQVGFAPTFSYVSGVGPDGSYDMTLSGFSRIAVDPAVCGGRPIIAGTRMRVTDILEMLAGGATSADITADFPYITENDVRAALAFAASQSDHPIVIAAE